jgi:hypothetical protein
VKKVVPPILLCIGLWNCTPHLDIRSVNRTNGTIIDFLIKVVVQQDFYLQKNGAYDEFLRPAVDSESWEALAGDYRKVVASEYSCEFNILSTQFQVSCTPNSASGFRISFFVDNTRIVRMSADGTAGPTSPAVILTPAEERKLGRPIPPG